MIQIENSVLNDEATRNLFVKHLLDETGITRNIIKLVNYIEDDINGKYSNGESFSSDTTCAVYGGVVSEGYELVAGEKIATFLRRLLTDNEATKFLELSAGNLYLSVQRSDFEIEHEWKLCFEFVADGYEPFTVETYLKVSTTEGCITNITTDVLYELEAVNDN